MECRVEDRMPYGDRPHHFACYKSTETDEFCVEKCVSL